MCLLITQTKQTPALNDAWLKDYYSYNSDGVGVMRVVNNELIITKSLPQDASEFINFYRDNIQGHKCAWHLRMRTHGDIDLANCHPYEILNQRDHGLTMWLMHNGILSTGNQADVKKSDTWHYIKNYLRPMLVSNPAFAYTNAFKDIISAHIGASNKFVIMDNQGRQAVINQDAGVYWSGMWLSNTYAWSAPHDVSKRYSKDKKQWSLQARSFPEKKTKYPSWKSSAWYQNEDETITNDYYDYDDDVLMYLDDLNYCGYTSAGAISYDLAYDFIEKNSLEGFKDVCDYLLEGHITESAFIEMMYSPYKAKQYFPDIRQYSLIED